MLSDQTRVDSFTGFVEINESKVRRALTAVFGTEAGRDAAADAFAVAWTHWDRVEGMDNPVGYLYRIGYNSARRPGRSGVAGDFDQIADHIPWVEPGLGPALAALPDQQRIVVALVHAYEWSLSEVAMLLEVSKSTVQTHEQRAMKRLRKQLGASK